MEKIPSFTDRPREECGVFGIFTKDKSVAEFIFTAFRPFSTEARKVQA